MKYYTVLVYYKTWQEPPNAMLDGSWCEHTKIIDVSNLTDLNEKFKHMTDVKILEMPTS